MTASQKYVRSRLVLKLLLLSLILPMLLSACAANLEGKFSLPKDAPAAPAPVVAPPAAAGGLRLNAETRSAAL